MEAYFQEDLSHVKAAVQADGLRGECYMTDALRFPSSSGRRDTKKSFATILPAMIKGHILVRNAAAHQWYTRQITDQPNALIISRVRQFIYSDYYYKHYLNHLTETANQVLLPAELRCICEVVHFGKTSSIFIVRAVDPTLESTPEVMRYVETNVRLDAASRKPFDIKYGLQLSSDVYPKLSSLPKHDFRTAPSTMTSSATIVIEECDVDHNRHTNATTYKVLFNLSLEEMLEKRALVGFEGVTMTTLFAKELSVNYQRESLLGDQVELYIWVDEENTNIIYGQFVKGGTSIAQLRLECKLKLFIEPNHKL